MSTTMQMSTSPQQTALEKRILALGPSRAQQLSILLSSLSVAIFSYAYSQNSSLQASPIFATQLIITVLFISSAPALLHISFPQPSAIQMLFLAIVMAAIPLPVFYAFMKNILTGHLGKANPHWLDAVWRVYAVFLVWIGFAIVNEAKIRPRLRARAIRLRDEKAARVAAGEEEAPVANTVAARADAMRRKDRDVKLMALRDRLIAAKRVRDEATAALGTKEGGEVRARERVGKAEAALKRARGGGDTGEIEEAEEVLEGFKEMAVGVTAMSRAQVVVLKDATERIKELDEQWLHWSCLDNYPFYR